MKLSRLIGMIMLMIGSSAMADGTTPTQFSSTLSGYEQAPPIVSRASGTFTATLNPAGTSLTYSLNVSDLSSRVTMAHIHFAQEGVNGAPVAFLCGGGSAPPCPLDGVVAGTLGAADVLPASSQGVIAGDFSHLLSVILSGNGYVNVHTTLFPEGEIRGQIQFPTLDGLRKKSG